MSSTSMAEAWATRFATRSGPSNGWLGRIAAELGIDWLCGLQGPATEQPTFPGPTNQASGYLFFC